MTFSPFIFAHSFIVYYTDLWGIAKNYAFLTGVRATALKVLW